MIELLNGHSLEIKTQFAAEKLSVELSERSSTATMTVSDDAPVISVGNWIRWEKGPGSGTVWRVKTISQQYEKKTRTVSLEHMINSLRDMLLFGDTTPADMGGGAECTAEQAARYILGKQSSWKLGGIAYSNSEAYSFNGDDLYSALETVSTTLEDCIWEYDFSSYPFKLYIRKLNSTVVSEMREDRNIKTLKKTIDRSRMYTRFYPIGKNNLTISGKYVSKNENLYGVICRTETDQSLDTETKLRKWATHRLRRHCEPSVTITINGLDLSEATGEPLDSFAIGRMCRVPLPEFETTITERVTKLSYSDIVAFPDNTNPANVTVTLANERQDVASIIRQMQSSSAGGGRAGAKKAQEDMAWFEDTNDHVSMVAKGIIGEDAEGNPNWTRLSEIRVDGGGISATVKSIQKDVEIARSEIKQNEDEIKLTVKKGNIISEINQTAERIQIKANKIDLSGYVTASQLKATNAIIDNLTTGRSTANALMARAVYATMGFTYQGHACAFYTVTINGESYHMLGYR